MHLDLRKIMMSANTELHGLWALKVNAYNVRTITKVYLILVH